MLIKTSELTDAALDWAVAEALNKETSISPYVQYPNSDRQKIVGYGVYLEPAERDEFGAVPFTPSVNWEQGMLIIDTDGIWTQTTDEGEEDPSCKWRATLPYRAVEIGPTILIAAMRCKVASEFGETVNIPDELCC